MATKGLDNLGAEAAHNTTALNPMMGGLNRKELLGAVTMMLRRTRSSPIAGVKYAGRMTKESAEILIGKSKRAPEPKDRRFQDPAWTYNPFYKRALQGYLAMEENLHHWVDDLKLDELEHARAQFVMGMIIDAISPTNSLVGNPMAQKQVINSGGLSLVKGLQNLYEDMTKNGGMPSMVDKRPFKVGENVANTPGKVVWKNDLMELIQYTPTTDKVHKIPFLQIPPQINKFYASDLSPEKSVIRFLLSQGIQTFIVSWANPTPKDAHWGLIDYIDSLIQATEVIKQITGSPKLNASGACSGGITTATFASTLAAVGDDRINTLTFQVCVLD
ncbi:MAG: class II poly(R)-hydroxyalkanoic acid synthase, partial [Hyphomonadaceae bacterium]